MEALYEILALGGVKTADKIDRAATVRECAANVAKKGTRQRLVFAAALTLDFHAVTIFSWR
jgi:hypothetical protein